MLRRIEKALLSVGIVATAAVLTAWSSRALLRKPGPTNATTVRALFDAKVPGWFWLIVAGAVALVIAALIRRPSLIRGRTLGVLTIATLFTTAACISFPHGHHAGILALAIGTAILVATQFPPRFPTAPILRKHDNRIALAAWILVTTIHCIYSMHRYYWMGAGSWDLGCMIHNLYRASRFLDSTSTVLGDVDYLGDHFMIGLYLYAPFAWINANGYTMLFLQSASLAATAPVIFLLARDHKAPMFGALALSISAALAFGMQSGAYFDAHEITVGFGFLAFGVLFFERRQLGKATIFFILFSLFKESLGAYVVALGLLAIWRGIHGRDRCHLIYGTAWMIYGAIWFVLVNRYFMPALIARAKPPEPHETYADFGPTVFQAAYGIFTHPLEAIGALFTPTEKISSILVTFGGLGFLALARPQLLLAAAPLFAERFLSSKSSMWEMGYHYAVPLTFYSAWGAALAWPKVQELAERSLRFFSKDLENRGPHALAIYVLASAILINGGAYRHPANYHHWTEDYFSTPERRATNAEAIALIKTHGREAKVAVQNRMLPHLADRPHVWRLGEYNKADFALLNVAEDAWPYDGGHPKRLAQDLARNSAWKLIYSKGDTALFARTDKTQLPAVEPSPTLGIRKP